MAARTGHCVPWGGTWKKNSSDQPYSEPAWYASETLRTDQISIDGVARSAGPHLFVKHNGSGILSAAPLRSATEQRPSSELTQWNTNILYRAPHKTKHKRS
ncbi:hypothetical protein MSG28_004850 [Choristoneura fumiferana]|uniref:Uncharacterized protein n=1 Tax=Choristoneura fumiferana TaxID=7141 RepID=A0ACC0K8C2_CHOFU|nr:hypothetical protein MSG28_004850 [Choristoneura fumiferana]